jgi:hypothetical protein
MATNPTTIASPRDLLAGPGLLRRALRLDALVSGANGVAYLAAAGPLGDLLSMPTGVLRAVGGFLVVFAVAVWATSSRPRPGAVKAIIALNAVWVAESLAVAALGAWSPSAAGTVWTVLQAGAVAAFAALQVAGLRRLR